MEQWLKKSRSSGAYIFLLVLCCPLSHCSAGGWLSSGIRETQAGSRRPSSRVSKKIGLLPINFVIVSLLHIFISPCVKVGFNIIVLWNKEKWICWIFQSFTYFLLVLISMGLQFCFLLLYCLLEEISLLILSELPYSASVFVCYLHSHLGSLHGGSSKVSVLQWCYIVLLLYIAVHLYNTEHTILL